MRVEARGIGDMRILIDGKAHETWGRREDADVRFSKHVGPSEGRVLSAKEAKAAAASATRTQWETAILWNVSLLLVIVVIGVIMGGGEGGTSPLEILALLLIAALFVALNVLIIAARGEERQARLSGGRLPPAGAFVTFDETAVRLDNAVIPWASLTAELLVVIESGGEDTRYYDVERIEAADGDRTQLFDLYLYSNGAALVRMAYLKLIRERLPGLKR